jgi:SAM-dependent methyltransferase
VSHQMHTGKREAASVRYYDLNVEEYCNKSVHIKLGSLYYPFLSNLPQSGHILDAGCGCGRDTKYFLSLGYQVTAVDASEAMVNFSSELTGQETMQLDFRDFSFEDTFDGIWSFASLLHIPKDEIDQIFHQFTVALREEGVWYMSFKEGEDEQWHDGRLFNNYTKSSLNSLLVRHYALEVIDIWCSSDCVGRNQKWVNALVQKKSY